MMRPCLSCGRLFTGRGPRCPTCQAAAYSGSTLKPRGSGWAWGRLRASILAAQPWCGPCAREGKSTAAVTVDHRVARVDGGTDDLSNLVPICKAHHDAKHHG
jgi:5-methylcytosine-specific restriction enzyme A